MACTDVTKRALTQSCSFFFFFLDRVGVLCAKLCQIPHLTGSVGSTPGCMLTETAVLSVEIKRTCTFEEEDVWSVILWDYDTAVDAVELR